MRRPNEKQMIKSHIAVTERAIRVAKLEGGEAAQKRMERLKLEATLLISALQVQRGKTHTGSQYTPRSLAAVYEYLVGV